MPDTLSPAAQAVLDAYVDEDRAGRLAVAAALRETVNQLKFFGITEKNILAIATELEASNG